NFEGSTSQAIVIHMPESGCLRVLGSRWGDEFTYARQSGYLLKAIPLSNPDLILANEGKTATLPFLSEPEHSWCYYHAKAELARQENNWQRVIDLLEEATSLGYEANDPFEWLVFIEADAMMGNLESAKKRSADAMEWDGGVRKGLCQVWKRVQAHDPERGDIMPQVEQVLANFQCPP
ncbi:MAG TPA: hypothetical protein VFY78_03385, partial [Gammaproteobacteria bacterium]|nr:hypothetical protein [Gammaproteobacteria bacterium]